MKRTIIISSIILLILLTACDSPETIQQECTTNADCVPATCCHPDSCVSIENSPDCNDIFCTQECAPNTLDCRQGSCRCINNQCNAVIKQ